MSDKSESFRKGVNLNLGKTFESGLNIGFDSFIGETTEKGKYNTPTKNIVKIAIKEFENVPIHHTQLKHKKDII